MAGRSPTSSATSSDARSSAWPPASTPRWGELRIGTAVRCARSRTSAPAEGIARSTSATATPSTSGASRRALGGGRRHAARPPAAGLVAGAVLGGGRHGRSRRPARPGRRARDGVAAPAPARAAARRSAAALPARLDRGARRVTRVLYSFPTRLGTAGIGTTACEQVAGLAARGHDVTVVCGSLERPLPPGSTRARDDARGQRPGPLPPRRQGPCARHHDRRAARLLADAGPDRLDVVHTWPLGAEATLAAAQETGTPSVLERPNAHTAFAFAAVAEVLDELGLEPTRQPARPDPPAWRARSASTRSPMRCCARRTSSRGRSASAACPRPPAAPPLRLRPGAVRGRRGAMTARAAGR